MFMLNAPASARTGGGITFYGHIYGYPPWKCLSQYYGMKPYCSPLHMYRSAPFFDANSTNFLLPSQFMYTFFVVPPRTIHGGSCDCPPHDE